MMQGLVRAWREGVERVNSGGWGEALGPEGLSESLGVCQAAPRAGGYDQDSVTDRLDCIAMAANASAIQQFLAATRFCVVGASVNRAKYGNKVLRCYVEHKRNVTPVNPRESVIEGLPCVPSLDALERPEDVSVSVITPPKVTLVMLEEAHRVGIRRLWLQPGSEDSAVIEKAHQLGFSDTLIYGGPCVLVELGFDEH